MSSIMRNMLPWIVARGDGLIAVYFLRGRLPLWQRLLFATPVVAIAVAALLLGLGMRMEMEGGGLPRFVTFENQE